MPVTVASWVLWGGTALLFAVCCYVVLARAARRTQRMPRTRTFGEVLNPNWCLQFARRAEQPLSILRVTSASPVTADHGARDALQRSDQLALDEIRTRLRSSDIIIVRGDDERTGFDVFCFNTDKLGVAKLAGRLIEVLATCGSAARLGSATFPDDGYALSELEQSISRASVAAGADMTAGRAKVVSAFGTSAAD